MRIDPFAIAEFIDLGRALFGKKARARRKINRLVDAGLDVEAFKSAREKVDKAADEGKAVRLTIAQTKALDFAMDAFTKAGRKVKRKLR